MTVTFQKSVAAALLSGAVAFMTPVLLHAQTTTTTSGSASGSVSAQPANGASEKAGANAAGAANTATNPSGTTATGTYGGMGTDQTNTINSNVKKAKQKAASPMSSPNDSSMTTQPH